MVLTAWAQMVRSPATALQASFSGCSTVAEHSSTIRTDPERRKAASRSCAVEQIVTPSISRTGSRGDGGLPAAPATAAWLPRTRIEDIGKPAACSAPSPQVLRRRPPSTTTSRLDQHAYNLARSSWRSTLGLKVAEEDGEGYVDKATAHLQRQPALSGVKMRRSGHTSQAADLVGNVIAVYDDSAMLTIRGANALLEGEADDVVDTTAWTTSRPGAVRLETPSPGPASVDRATTTLW